jgi:hypothetical protein
MVISKDCNANLLEFRHLLGGYPGLFSKPNQRSRFDAAIEQPRLEGCQIRVLNLIV